MNIEQLPEELRHVLRRGVAEIIVEEELVQMLQSGRPLRLKQGFDPSRSDIHLGHVVGLRKLRQLQELGHQVILIVGDWTAQIGDPSGQSKTRTMLSAEEVRANAETYMQQFFKVVDREKTQVAWQSRWFGNFTLADVISLTRRFTLAQMLAREDFRRRYDAGSPIAITELLYPLLQAYDSVEIEADVEFGGLDQKFNCLVGRQLQGMVGQRQQQVFLVPLLVGTDGTQKMSKSLGNYIGVDDEPPDMYGKVMSISDDVMMDYFELLTDVPDEELAEFRSQLSEQSVNPMLLKQRLAREIVAQFHGPEAADVAEAHFNRVVRRGEVPEDVVEYKTSFASIATVSAVGGYEGQPTSREGPLPVVDLTRILVAANMASSRSEARRLVSQGAVEVDGRIIDTPFVAVRHGSVIRVGRRRFVRLVNTDEDSTT